MAGHSHWANIARKKSLIDNKRGKVWSKLSKAIIVAAKAGGGDPDANLKLRYAIDAAKAISMPKDNIQRAIKRGTGELEGGNLEEIIYEGYGAGGVAVLCEILTDNRNRTAGEIRKSLRAGRRQAGRHRLRGLDVRAQGHVPRAGRHDGRRQPVGICPRARRRRREASRRQIRNHLRPQQIRPSRRGPQSTRAFSPKWPKSPASPRRPSISTPRQPARCYRSWSGSTTTTTCKACRRISTSRKG